MDNFVISTQNLGTTAFVFFILTCVYLWYKNNKHIFTDENYLEDEKINFDNKWLIRAGIAAIIGFVLVYVYNPIKVVQPTMDVVEAREKQQIVVPEKVEVKTETLEEAQKKLIKEVSEQDNK